MAKNNKTVKIKREKVWIDPKIVSSNYQHEQNSAKGVKYCLYYDPRPLMEEIYIPENPTDEFKTKWIVGWCFADLLSRLHKNKKCKGSKCYNRIYYKIKSVSKNVILKKDEKIKYIKLAKEHKFLPNYVDEGLAAIDNILVLKLDNLVQAQLYMYLCIYRFLQEDPGVVRSMVHLVDRGIDYYAAYVIACRVALNYSVHNFVQTTRLYGEGSDDYVNTTNNIPLSTVIAVRRFSDNPQKYDDASVYGAKSYFVGYKKIEAAAKVPMLCTVQDLADPLLKKAIYATNDKDAKKIMEEYINIKPNITYIKNV